MSLLNLPEAPLLPLFKKFSQGVEVVLIHPGDGEHPQVGGVARI